MQKLTKEKINQIGYLWNKGFNKVQIAKQLGINEETVRKYLKTNFNVQLKDFSKKIDHKTFVELWSKGKTDKEIADYFGVKEVTIRTYRTRGENAGKYNIIRNFSQEEHNLSYEQEQFVLGSLLGDLNLSNPKSNRSKNSRLAIVQCEKQKELFMKKVEILGEFMGSYRLTTSKPDPRTGKIYTGYRGNSKAHKVFTDIYNLLYINEKKTITKEYLNKITSPIALAFWFMDDGSECGTIATNSFSLDEVKLLQNWLLEKWNISSMIWKNRVNYVLHIDNSSRQQFENLIKPYIIPSMEYKLKYK